MDDINGGPGGIDPVERPRVLFVSDEVAWPPTSGYRQRTAQCLRALAAVGSVDWLAAPRVAPPDPSGIAPPGIACERVALAVAGTRSPGAALRRWARLGLPWPLAVADWSDADRSLAKWRGRNYDLIWAMGIDPWLAVRRAGLVGDALVIDMDIESEKLRLRAMAKPWSRREGIVRAPMARLDVRRWRLLEARGAAAAAAVCVCSDAEADLVDGTTWVVPNAATDPGPVQRSARGEVMLFVGSLSYEPNVDGVTRFAREVLPRIRAALPDGRLRVVGAGLGDQHPLRGLRGVEVVGPVEDMARELAAATMLVVPLRWGGGTRVKIVEAFAHRVPVVSTRVGAAGLGAADGVHLLLADADDAFADACVRVLSDGGLRVAMADAAHELFVRHFDSRAVHEVLTAHVRSLVE